MSTYRVVSSNASFVLLVTIAACGGSGSANNSNSGGSSSGGVSGTGATGGSSATGGTSATGGIGGSGGTSATGGSGGTAATGGFGGSSSVICTKLDQLDCFGDNCDAALAATTQQALAKGCKAEAEAAFQCIEGDTPFCDPTKAGVQYGEACQPALDSYFSCLAGTSQCTHNGFIGTCVVVCGSSWAAECTLKQATDTAWSCFCRVGPNLGKTFELAPEDKCSETLAAEQCQ